MSTSQIWSNLVAYSLQIGLLVGSGALLPPLLRLQTPRAKLLFWQLLLIACIVLPAVQPWRQEVVSVSNVNLMTTLEPAVAASAGVSSVYASVVRHPMPVTAILLYLFAAGALVRLVWLGVGLARLAGYRRRGHSLAPDAVSRIATDARVRLLVSDEISGPVTFGWRDPVVLLPARFLSLQPALREAILCHELIHVERHDWLITLAEEFVRAVFWFHPAVWWVLGEIQLAREQTVDCSVVEITHARGHYLDALLAMAAPPTAEHGLDLAPAPLFLRRRHLKQRISELLEEVRVAPFSGIRLLLAVAAIAGGCSLVSGAFPLAATPQLVADDAGVVVNIADAKLRHRTPVAYPAEAVALGLQGNVEILARVDADGGINADSKVECLWPELCDAAIASLPNWKFDPDQANTIHKINIDFVRQDFAMRSSTKSPVSIPLHAQNVPPPSPFVRTNLLPVPASGTVTFICRTIWLDGSYVSAGPATAPNALGHPLTEIRIAGLSAADAQQLKSRLPVQAGDIWGPAAASIVSQMVKDFDPHLEVDMIDHPATHEWSLWIGPSLTTQSQSLPGAMSLPIGVKPPALLSRVDPAYTDSAKNAGISGSVSLAAEVDADGKAQNIRVVTPLEPGLDEAAIDALSKWRFRPGTKDGVPVSVQAQINFSFRLL